MPQKCRGHSPLGRARDSSGRPRPRSSLPVERSVASALRPNGQSRIAAAASATVRLCGRGRERAHGLRRRRDQGQGRDVYLQNRGVARLRAAWRRAEPQPRSDEHELGAHAVRPRARRPGAQHHSVRHGHACAPAPPAAAARPSHGARRCVPSPNAAARGGRPPLASSGPDAARALRRDKLPRPRSFRRRPCAPRPGRPARRPESESAPPPTPHAQAIRSVWPRAATRTARGSATSSRWASALSRSGL